MQENVSVNTNSTKSGSSKSSESSMPKSQRLGTKKITKQQVTVKTNSLKRVNVQASVTAESPGTVSAAKEITEQHVSVNTTPSSTKSGRSESKAKKPILSHVRKRAVHLQSRSQKIVDEQRRKTRERVRKHRAKMTEEARQKRREDDRGYRRMRKLKNIDKSIKELSCREQRKLRKRWRTYTRAHRQRIAAAKEAAAATVTTPMNRPSSVALDRTSSSHKSSGRRQVRIGRSRVVRELKRKSEQLERKEKEVKHLKTIIASVSRT